MSELPKDEPLLVACRIKFSRSVAGLSLPPQMTAEQRRDLEMTLKGIFMAFESSDFAATCYSLQDATSRPEV